MSMGAQARVRWVEYADMLKGNTELLGGVYKPFNQKHLMSAWANLGAMSKVKKGVCRALSAAYLCRQYAKSRVPNLDDDEAALEELAKQDPKLLMSSLGKFFDVFREGRISDDEVKTLRNRGKVEREKRPEWQSGLAPKIDPFGFGFGVEQSGHLTIKEDDKWEQRAHKEWEPWRVRRVEQVAEAHYEAKKSRPKEFPKGDPLAPYHSDMDKTMAFFADSQQFCTHPGWGDPSGGFPRRRYLERRIVSGILHVLGLRSRFSSGCAPRARVGERGDGPLQGEVLRP
jgi:hypothetical protein